MKEILFKGCATALVTPFTDDGINFKELENLIEFQIAQGIDALVVCGTTGESATMTLQEKKDVIKFTTKVVNSRVPVIAGTGSNSTNSCINLSKYVQDNTNVNGLLIVTPYYNKATQYGLIKHYSEIACNVNLPIIVYNVPGRTGLNILPETCLELSKIENIVAIKEASGNISQVANISNLCRDSLPIYSGNDDQILPVLSLGGIGVISVLSNIMPKEVTHLIHDFMSGNISKAINSQLNMIDLVTELFSEVNPIPIKYALNLLGYNMGTPRLPLTEMSEIGKKNLEKVMQKYRLLSY